LAGRGLLGRIDSFDRRFSAGVERRPLPDAVRLAAHHYSEAGEWLSWVLAALATAALFDRRQRPVWRRANRGVVIGRVVDRAIKHLVGRERPPTPLVEKADKRDSPSFPSSHTTTAFAMARAYSPLLPQLPLYTIAATQAASRLVANVHYPSDVLAGIGLGLLAGRSRRG
jgi:membrane-associated phospholipid phosphatase